MSDTALNKIIQYGTAANRALFTPSPASGSKILYIWVDSDNFPTTAPTWIWDGSAFVQINPSSGMVLIADSVLGGDTASVSFTSIPGTYRHLKIIANGRITEAVTDDYVYLRFNNDSGANYDFQANLFFSTTDSGSTNAAQTRGRCGDWTGASSSSANQSGSMVVDIPNYAGTTFNKSWIATCGSVVAASGTIGASSYFTGGWRNTAAITRVDLFPAANNFKAGSVFSLYGLA